MATATLTPEFRTTRGKIRIRGVDEETPSQAFEGPDAILASPHRTYDNFERDAVNTKQGTTAQNQELEAEERPLVRLSTAKAAGRLVKVLQQWEGTVCEVTEESVWAELLDLTDRGRAYEIVELPLVEIPAEDIAILGPGSVFYWTIGYERSLGGQIRRVSEIRVRRTPVWSQHSIDLLKARAEEWMSRLRDNVKSDSATE